MNYNTENVTRNINLSTIKISHYFTQFLRNYHINYYELLLLNHLYYHGDCTQKIFSNEYGVLKQTTHLAVKNLEKKGCLRMYPVPGNNKEKYLTITDEGIKCATDYAKELDTIRSQIIDNFGKEKIELLDTLLKEYIATVESTIIKEKH